MASNERKEKNMITYSGTSCLKLPSNLGATDASVDADESVASDITSDRSCKSAASSSSYSKKNDDDNLSLLSNTRDNWDEMYQRLVNYKSKHGHCRVPYRYKKDQKLGTWVSVQRRHYKILKSGRGKKAALNPDRESRLDKIGFQWSCEVPWETHFNRLLEFVATNGHAQVPMKWGKDPKFSNWVSSQRREYKHLQLGRPSSLQPNQIQLLNRVGFVWQADRGGAKRIWEGKISAPDSASSTLTSPLFKARALAMLNVNNKNTAIGLSQNKNSEPSVETTVKGGSFLNINQHEGSNHRISDVSSHGAALPEVGAYQQSLSALPQDTKIATRLHSLTQPFQAIVSPTLSQFTTSQSNFSNNLLHEATALSKVPQDRLQRELAASLLSANLTQHQVQEQTSTVLTHQTPPFLLGASRDATHMTERHIALARLAAQSSTPFGRLDSFTVPETSFVDLLSSGQQQQQQQQQQHQQLQSAAMSGAIDLMAAQSRLQLQQFLQETERITNEIAQTQANKRLKTSNPFCR